MSRAVLNLGYVPLVDAAPLVIARELGFAAEEGLTLNLLRQPGWSALRDLLALGQLDAAHILSPLPIAMSLGLGGFSASVDALMTLSANGNVIGVSAELAARMRAWGWDGRFDTPVETGRALLGVAPDARIGVPFPHSMHVELVHYWLGALGADVPKIVTVPPAQMADAVRTGDVDAFCVGEPWGSVAVESGAGELILPGAAIWGFAPEKVLGARRDWVEAHPAEARALMRAIWRAGEWLARPDNRALASEVLARSAFLDLPAALIDRALRGELPTRPRALAVRVPQFLRFHDNAATFPWRSQAAWIAARLASRHGLEANAAIAKARDAFRTDLYRTNLADLVPDLPCGSEKIEGAMAEETAAPSLRGEVILGPDAFFDGQVFDMTPDASPKNWANPVWGHIDAASASPRRSK